MVEKLEPEINKVYFINQYTLIHILSGTGAIEVDFKHYLDWEDKAIYLEKGQYIRFRSDDFVVRKIEFPTEQLFRNKDFRVLFKHLISLGYIHFDECSDCKKYLNESVFHDQLDAIVDVSSEQWFWQNPFGANREEYQVIFDIKDLIDAEFSNHLTSSEVVDMINQQGYNANALVRERVGLSIKNLMSRKQLVESQKEIAFTDKNIQEIAFELGYSDPAYFNRSFKKATGQSPVEYRKNYDFEHKDLFIQYLLELIKTFHTQERSLEFYADQMNLSVKTLSRKVSQKMNLTLGAIIRNEVLETAKRSLLQGASVKEVAFQLKFEEPNHFTAFFKHYAGNTPSEFLAKKYNS
ncbi:MAG: AraC family transcriptional regulator [Cytophagales bacterium]|nr:AraC family transcriptional regulator [Cytophagales bacterium]